MFPKLLAEGEGRGDRRQGGKWGGGGKGGEVGRGEGYDDKKRRSKIETSHNSVTPFTTGRIE